MTKIAFLGLGAMGSRMAAKLVGGGFDVTAWNRSDPSASSIPMASSIQEAVSGADMVLTMLTDDSAATEVWGKAFPEMTAGALAVEMSTVSPDRITAFVHEAESAGCAAIAAPVAGSRPQAEAGELIFMAGGSPDEVARFQPVAEAMGKAVLKPGTQQQAVALKLMVNGLLAVQAAAMGELLAFADHSGFSAEGAMALLSPVPVTSTAASFVGGQIARGEHAPMFPIDLMVKDLDYLIKESDAPALTGAMAAFRHAQAAGHGGLHISAVGLT